MQPDKTSTIKLKVSSRVSPELLKWQYEEIFLILNYQARKVLCEFFMKKTLIFVICILSLLSSCDKLFVGISGKEADLQGKWQMDGADSVYFNFQNSLFLYQIYEKKDVLSQAFGYYTLYKDSGLDLRLLREYSSISLDHLGWDTLVSITGQDTLYKAFKIEGFTKNKIVLSSEDKKISLHKF